ncbi:hypothetical protein KSP40_PGU016484 [Platanthera guangdongensis]|uniref:DUF220 domain-containing protein n=1 Tax=Platanthera guangdongensis TaxID=2320717 RepID=A0ABR2M6P3_9ASPA
MKQSTDTEVCAKKGWRESPASLPDLFMKINEKFHDYFQLGSKLLVKNQHKFDTMKTIKLGEDSAKPWEVELERQLQAWRENSYWVDQPPEIEVTVPKGSLCNLNAKLKIGLPPDAVFNIITDPDNRRVFKNIKEVISRRVVVDDGTRQVVEVEQAAIWKFLWWSGTISVHVVVAQCRRDHEVNFKQGKSGFLERFEGSWKIEPLFVDEQLCSPHKPKSWAEYETCSGGKGRLGSIVSLQQLIQPAIVPPPPISWYLRGITTRTTEMLMRDLLGEALRLRTVSDAASRQRTGANSDQKMDFLSNCSNDIKERWQKRRVEQRKRS